MSEPKKRKLNSRWRRPNLRYSTERKIERARWARNGRRAWRLSIDSVSEVGYCREIREAAGFHRGARVRMIATH